MSNRPKLLILIAAFWLWPLPQAHALESLTVMADNSMSMAMVEIARRYSARHNIVVNTSFSVAAAQQKLITEGGAVDVLVTPQLQWIETLKTQGLIDIYSPTVIASDSLVLVGPRDSPIRFGPEDKALPTAAIIRDIGAEPGFVVGNPESLVEGGFSKEALRELDRGSLLAPYTLYIKNLDQMFGMVRDHGAYGIFLYSSTVHRTGFRVLGRLPPGSYRSLQYYALVVAGENMDEARRFLDYLESNEAKTILKDNGFSMN